MYRRPNLVPRSPTAKGKGKQSEIWVRDYRRPPPSGNIGRVSPLDFFSGRKDVCTRPIISPAFAKLTENWVNWVIGCSNKTRLVLLHTVYSRLADTLLIRTPRLCGQKPVPPPRRMHKEMTVTNSDPAITDSRYYGNADTFLPPRARFHLFFLSL